MECVTNRDEVIATAFAASYLIIWYGFSLCASCWNGRNKFEKFELKFSLSSQNPMEGTFFFGLEAKGSP
jgi:hypothetical protein